MTLEEVKNQTCMDYLTSMFGIEVDNIDNDFEAFDENKDGIVSIQESMNALKNLALDRSNLKDVWDVIESNGFSMEYLDNLEAFLNFHIFLEFHVCLKQTSMQFHKVCIFKWSEFVDLLSDDKFKGDLRAHGGLHFRVLNFGRFHFGSLICGGLTCGKIDLQED